MAATTPAQSRRAERTVRRKASTRGRNYLYVRPILLVVAVIFARSANAWKDAAADLLVKGDAALSENKLDQSIEHYSKAIQHLPQIWYGKDDDGFEEDDAAANFSQLSDGKEIELILSIYTNYGTALSYLEGSSESVLSAYRTSCMCYRHWKRQMEAQSKDDVVAISKEIKDIATQSYFFLGMTYQDLASATTNEENGEERQQQQQKLEHAARAYAAATKIDPNHWSSFANMGVVLADVGIDHGSGNEAASMGLYEEGIMAYQRAIGILTGVGENDSGSNDEGPTDPPENVREVVSELHYRIGLSLVPFLFTPNKGGDDDNDDFSEKQCTLTIGPKKSTTRSCLELSAFQFQTALQFHSGHEGASNALTFATADAVFGMSTELGKVQNLFEDYASTFEHSLVEELGYDGFHRMRGGFDRAMLAEGRVDKKFPLVIDAGCGTGLAGEVFRNISETLVGVDLSPAIIDLAKQSRPDLYSEFKTGDIKEILHQYASQGKQISLLVAADTFIYFNELSILFDAIKMGLAEGGYAIFSLENVSIENEKRLDQLKPNWRWQLTPSGRVAHRKQYVEETARAHSLDTILYEKLDNFRAESGVGVRGHMFVLKKQAQGKDEL
mmetsp:Transcript_12889/g.23155  ORF Transcript_12889/g.23155 Transcript_12889/m.23155 type:complete len:614 (-) Transcript_12889:272-2113(-)|eukprot:CAMPEP_0196160900 /NCGR_PEP_ID=MMETSP0910-20130528/47063_1 /TAXON_ID=49265 /ORGANISM="Thalassiosira rotula, Strain GSO102" /LENGTH=613 /DNA_ID=CAMNT_0041425841 /DNA_START=77 /DNA_END=1918 /DNA_ORIENTATION=-